MILRSSLESSASSGSSETESKDLLEHDGYSDSAVSNDSNETETMKSQQLQHQQQMSKAKALSLQFMKSFSGLCCDDCDNDPFKSIGKGHASNSYNWSAEGSNQDEVEKNEVEVSPNDHDIVNRSEDYFLNNPYTVTPATISPMVIGPMLIKNLDSQQPGTIETIIGEYMCFCRFYKVHYNSGILTAIRFSSPSLRPSGAFHDTDMLALVEMLLRHGNGALKHVTRLDFSIASKQGRHERNRKLIGFTSHGALSLAKVLQTTKYIRQVFLPRHRIGPYGASAIFMACSMNPTIEDLNLRRCRIGKRGALAFCELILLAGTEENKIDANPGSRTTTARGLVNVNLSVNHIGHQGTAAIEKFLKERKPSEERGQIFVNLDGNLVFPEIMNAVTHCIGVMLSLFGGRLLLELVKDKSYTHIISCGVYSGSLLALYLSSTLFHSFFTTINARYVFRVMDKCAIYILIAGSYTPFIQILLSDQPLFSFGLLGFIWICCVLGISVEAFCPNWKYRQMFSLSMYLGMGWSCMVCLPLMIERLHASCISLIVLGGVAYTAGVPFFKRNNNLDHAIWHLFVMTGSLLHWTAIYFYVAPTPLHEFVSEKSA